MADTMPRTPSLIPPLRPHDRLSRAEFERRFDATPWLKKAELLHGAVYVAEPVRHVQHSRPHSLLAAWLTWYVDATPDADQGADASVRMPGDNMPQPDLLLRIPEDRGGRSRIDADGYVQGAPELVVEVTASTVSYDLHDKLEVYRESGVREYVVYRVEDGEVDWFVLRDGRYRRHRADASGCIRSTVWKGLWLDVGALLREDRRALRAAVERGIAAR